jgi:uncharacterized RDD family membrane protein YckC
MSRCILMRRVSPESVVESQPSQSTRVRQLAGTAGFERLVAASIDQVAAGYLFFLALTLVSGDGQVRVSSCIAATASYLGYYYICEWLFGATIGKFLLGVRVRQVSGQRCTASQAATRTVLRLVEVNPLLLGALPAVASMFLTQKRQRIGDWLAGTVVITRKALRRSHLSPTCDDPAESSADCDR